MANSIRIGQQDTIKIEVNDAGEYIEINTNDKRFTVKLAEFAKSLKAELAEAETKVAEYAKKQDANVDDFLAAAEYEAGMCQRAAEKIDGMFGAGSCGKIFGVGVIPSLDNLVEFFNAITPFIREAVAKRQTKINGRYSPNRNGSV